jgi:thioredoxin 1
MSEETRQPDERSINYDLSISEKEALSGVQKILQRNGKRLQVNIPSGVNTGSVVKLTNALQITDGKVGDILIKVTIKNEKPDAQSQHSLGVVEINDRNFENEVLKADLPVAVDFWAPWCGPCRMMAPIMEKAAIQYQGKFKFCKINVDENPLMASQYKAMSIPLIIFFKGSQVIDKSLGAIPESQLFAKIEALL